MKGRSVIDAANFVVGLATADAKAGDFVCVLFGGETPFVPHKVEGEGHWVLVGACYIFEMIHGEIMKEVEAGERQVETFEMFIDAGRCEEFLDSYSELGVMEA